IKKLQFELAEVAIIDMPEEIPHEVDERFRFCTECLINQRNGKPIDHDELRARLEEIGNSLIVAGSPIKTKIHVHTNDPSQIFSICREYGDTCGEKADDMIKQQNSYANRENRVAILTDSSADLPPEVIAKFNIHVVPILINFGQQTYLDKISITPQEFHQALKNKSVFPTTSQPSFGDFHRQYQYLATHFDAIIALHIPRPLSGTLSASEKAAEKVGGTTKITVMDAGNVSAGQGLVVLAAAEAAAAGRTQDEIIAITKDAITKTQFYAAMPDLDSLVRSGRLPIKLKKLLDFFHLTPLATITAEGKVKPARLFFGRKNLAPKLFRLAKQKMLPEKKYRLSILHSERESEAIELSMMLKNHFKDQLDEVFVLPCCASLAVHAGTGALGIAIQER
ncbi:MAG: DegV family EDD domain-containing protein, partial [Gammaproteobacteria bacterium]|nr:DegV family EDD domain-containing protein [Gammaproteobacteria bacterium]